MLLESKTVNYKSKRQRWYNLYDEFVKKTIKGKFESEHFTKDFIRNKNLVSEYEYFISEIAFSVIKNASIKIVNKSFVDDDFILDQNISLYSIDYEKVKSIVKKELEESPKKMDIIMYLNCYFFDYKIHLSFVDKYLH